MITLKPIPLEAVMDEPMFGSRRSGAFKRDLRDSGKTFSFTRDMEVLTFSISCRAKETTLPYSAKPK